MLVWLPTQELADRLDGLAGVELEVVPQLDPKTLPASADQVEVVVLPHAAPLTAMAAALASLPRLRVVQSMSAGVEGVLTAVPDGVALLNARGVHTSSTSEWACAAVLASQREFPSFFRAQLEGRWSPRVTGTLDEATVLVIGAGDIGQAVAKRLQPFGCQLLRVARTARDGVEGIAALARLLPTADVVVLVVPLTAETTGMVDARFLASMRDGALLVNASRGAVVDTDALLAELTAQRLRAALDVTDPEPLPADHPLWSAPGLLLTPHIGGAVSTRPARVARMLADRLSRWAAGEEPTGVVTGTY
jgi:phosphoglycerate dehydrogenase-like enzyme